MTQKLRKDPEMERAARNRTLKVDTRDVQREYLESGAIFLDIYDAAELYGVFDDLFDDSVFTPKVVLRPEYDIDEDTVLPVHRGKSTECWTVPGFPICLDIDEIVPLLFIGNIIKPKEAEKAPSVSFDSHPDSLWTLVLTNPDGHFTDETCETVHWMVGNIKGNDLNTGEVLCEYLQPYPPFGVGYQRLVFILYKQVRV